MNYNKKMNRIEEAMLTHGVSPLELAERLGKKINYITNIKKCYTSLSLPMLYKIAKAIGCNPCELILGYDSILPTDLEKNRCVLDEELWKEAATE